MLTFLRTLRFLKAFLDSAVLTIVILGALMASGLALGMPDFSIPPGQEVLFGIPSGTILMGIMGLVYAIPLWLLLTVATWLTRRLMKGKVEPNPRTLIPIAVSAGPGLTLLSWVVLVLSGV